MAVLPSVISQCVEAFVSVNRVLKFLNSPEVDQQALLKNSQPAPPGEPAVMIPKGVSMFWDDEKTVAALRDLDAELDLVAGGLTLVIGKTGSGKSAFLQGLCGELNLKGQTPTLNGSISYASQLPWIQNSTVEENILFGLSMDRARYSETLQTCCLEADLQILPGGDQTEIGEKGSFHTDRMPCSAFRCSGFAFCCLLQL
jgi:ATP-binding cassette subfamily C (CFTR/MRP) protein 1